MKILLLCGSVAQKSHTRALLKYIEELFVANGSEVVFWDLKERPLPHIVPEYHRDPSKHHDVVVREFVALVDEVDGVILGSPLYHGSYSGVLKNAIDNLRSDGFRRKLVGLCGNAGGIRADHVQLTHLRNVVKTLYGYCAQAQVGTHRGDYEETKSGFVLKDEEIKKRCQRLVSEMLEIIPKFSENDNNKNK